MRVQIDCYQCIFSQISLLAKRASKDDSRRHALIRELLSMMLEAGEAATPPELASYFHAALSRETGEPDAFRREKDESTRLGLALLPRLRKRIPEGKNEFETLIRLAIGGNSIDYGVHPDFDLDDAERLILESFELPMDSAAAGELERQVAAAKSVFYILDNCGEAVLDRLLVERFADKVTIGVRGGPILNDVTRREAEQSGFAGFEIVDTGDTAPGVSLRNSRAEFLERMRSADLVISKGQGNYESLESYDRPIFFLLRIKCGVIAEQLKQPLGSLQIIGRNL